MLKQLRVTFSAVVLLGGGTVIALGQTTNERLTVPFPFPTYPPSICDRATLDSNGATLTNVKFAPVIKNGAITGCRLTFAIGNKQNLKPPLKAKFTDANGNTFTVTSDQLGSSTTPTAPLPAGWNQIKNTQDYNPTTQ